MNHHPPGENITVMDLDDMGWAPLPDPQKPPIPYRAGLALPIRRHVPPQPFGAGYKIEAQPRKCAPFKDLYNVVQSEWCLRHPPLETAPHQDQAVHHLQIVDEIGYGQDAQIVRCTLDQDEKHVLVAKIYDALYYPYDSGSDRVPLDVTHKADSDYSRESAAYEELAKVGLDGVLVPKYHGSWTFDLPCPFTPEPKGTRPVRMILLDWIRGIDLYTLLHSDDFPKIPPQKRLDILANAMEGWSKIKFHDVGHRDFAPRNVILVNSNWETPHPHVMLIDFNHSYVRTRPFCRYPGPKIRLRDLPISPRFHFWGDCPDEWQTWVPSPHRSRRAAFNGWLTTRWGQSQEFVIPVSGLERSTTLRGPVEMLEPMEDGQ